MSKFAHFDLPYKRGFTLVELLVAISIIAILSIVGWVVFTGVLKEARGTKRKGDIDSIAKTYEGKYSSSGYLALTDTDFAGGKIPTPYANGSYFVAGPNASQPTNKNFVVCGSLVDDIQCFSSSASCFCQTSSQGETIDTFSLGNPVLNGSFETNSTGGNLADSWTTYKNAANYGPDVFWLQSDQNGTILPKEGKFMQKVVAPNYSGITQIIRNLNPNSPYKQTAWIYPVNSGQCNSVGVGMSGAGGATTYTGCDQMNQWVQLSLTGKPDAQGNVSISFGNWAVPTFYVDAVKLEQVR